MSVLGTGCRLALAVIATLLWTDNAAQEERGASRTYWLNIPSQPLEGGLLDLARQTGMQIVFFSRLIEGQRGSAVQGSYTIDAALTALLAGSGLTFRLINERTIEITAPGARAWNELHLSSGSVESVYEVNCRVERRDDSRVDCSWKSVGGHWPGSRVCRSERFSGSSLLRVC